MPRHRPRLLALAALLSVAACTKQKGPAFRLEPVTRGPLVETVSATGDVSALVTVSVGSQVSGIVSRLYADFNSQVKRGQLLAELDPRLFRAALQRADAGLRAAEADAEKGKVDLADAERQYRRTEALVQKRLAAQADLDDALAKRDGARAALDGFNARVQLARADRDTAATNVSLCRITSPIDGIVISRNIDVGQTVAAAFQAPTLFTIANDLTRMQVLANIDEADVGSVRPGLSATFTVDAFPTERFSGTIRDVRSAPSTVDNVVTYAAVIDAANPDRKLRQGMTAQVSVVTARRENALLLPNAALRFHPPRSKPGARGRPPSVRPPARPRPPRTEVAATGAAAAPFAKTEALDSPPARTATVYRLVAGQPTPVRVTLGLSDGRTTEVLSGLTDSDRVVVGETGGPAAGGPRRGIF